MRLRLDGLLPSQTSEAPSTLLIKAFRDAREGKQHAAKRGRLRDAIDAAIAAESLIEAEQAALAEQARIEEDPVRRDYLEYQRDLVRWQLTRAADSARRRLAYWEKLRTKQDWAAERARCESDIQHFFRQWVWTIDPRSDSPLQILPLDPFPIQERAIEWLDRTVFYERRGGVQEKSRDMGATWINCAWSVKHWLFRPYFQALFSSRNEDEVDSKKEPDTIFEKLRFLVRYLPPELRPKGYVEREHATFCNLSNPENGAVISGAAPTVDLGRGGRYTVAFPDEFASFPHAGNPQYTALSESTRSVIATSTPKGKQNRFYELRQTPGMPIFRFHWADHPWKDPRWRAAQALTKKPHEIAQEIEIDYEASETGQLYREFDELVHLITWPEFAGAFGDAALVHHDDGSVSYRIPAQGSIGVGMDWGETPAHPTAVLWVWRPPERMALADCLFVYRQLVRPEWPTLPDGWKPPTARRIANEIVAAERVHGEAPLVKMRLMSPEQKEARDCFHGDPNAPDPLPEYLQLNFEGWNSRNEYGKAQLQQALEVDWTRNNPFRRYPVGHSRAGQPLPGFARIYFIADSSQAAVYCDGADELKVKPGVDDRGMTRIRAELPAKRRTTDAAGDERATDKKIFDDAIDGLRGILSQFGPPSELMRPEERAGRQLEHKRPDLAYEKISRLDEQQQIAAMVTKLELYEKELQEARNRAPRVLNRDPFGGLHS